jgi:hypothetical protein
MGTSNNHEKQQAADQKMIEGFTKHASELTNVVVGKKPVTVQQAVGVLQGRISSSKNAQTTKITWQASVKANRDLRAQSRTFVAGLGKFLLAFYQGDDESLADFGLAERKTPVVTPKTRVEAAAKAKATREARGTKGKKQRLAIKGAPATPAAPASPAPATGPTRPQP